MRSNMFGEKIAQPTDTVADCLSAWDHPTLTCADLFAERDETYKFGGELRTDEGDGFSFDGFDTLEAARTFAGQFVPAREVALVE